MDEDFVDSLRGYFKDRGVSQRQIAKDLNVGTSYVNGLMTGKKEFGKRTAQLFHDLYGLSVSWLLTGEGDMIEREPLKAVRRKDAIAYYGDLPVSAGEYPVMPASERSDGFIDLPFVRGKFAFSVIGTSMQPNIEEGDIVVADELDLSDCILDPDRIYMVITSSERMIKHLAVDAEDDRVVWCISDNYPRFFVLKEDIKRVFRITNVIKVKSV